MKRTFSARILTLTAACIAFCVILPIFFHIIPNAGPSLAPMHIPVLLCGLICGPVSGFLCGLTGPLLSSVLTGMPGAPILPAMTAECAVYGLVSGLMMRRMETGKLRTDLYISLITAMLLGRVAGGAVAAVLYTKGSYTIAIWAAAYFGKNAAGIVLHLITVPLVYFALEKAGLIPGRYPAAVRARA
jgi:uncharacterized membrane protein